MTFSSSEELRAFLTWLASMLKPWPVSRDQAEVLSGLLYETWKLLGFWPRYRLLATA